MNIPKDPIILLSYINTQLRDHYASLDDLCKSLNIEKSDLSDKLACIDYHYDDKHNQFI